MLAVILSITISLTITITSTGFVKVYADGFSKHPDTDLIETIRLTGVSKATAYKLAEKVKNGGILDSMNPKYNNKYSFLFGKDTRTQYNYNVRMTCPQ